jgi:hypothetical protein
VVWQRAKEPQQELRILAAAKMCLNAFGVDTLHDEGRVSDAARIETILTEMFPDADERAKVKYMDEVDAEVARPYNPTSARLLGLWLESCSGPIRSMGPRPKF